ncbi:uncharacterized protein LOC124141260 [Haliotis rufescens]|uniref:uncharacterized protein LOC124141260 n=1 Tax=Haliotis rufescens TaxID=6454 RepID=UPI00201FA7F8|nr:uncharacterized protein LOC124141260 [Haliotis rufescens]
MVLNHIKQTVMEAETVTGMKKSRRNGMANIFDGVDPEILERLGWTDEAIEKVEKSFGRQISNMSTSSTESELSESASESCSESDEDTQLDMVDNFQELLLNDSSLRMKEKTCSLSCTTNGEVTNCLANRRRRNGLADLFEALSVHQKQIFVKLIQTSPPTRSVTRVTGCFYN